MFWRSGQNSDLERLCYKAELFGHDPSGEACYSHYRNLDLNMVRKDIQNRKIDSSDKD